MDSSCTQLFIASFYGLKIDCIHPEESKYLAPATTMFSSMRSSCISRSAREAQNLSILSVGGVKFIVP